MGNCLNKTERGPPAVNLYGSPSNLSINCIQRALDYKNIRFTLRHTDILEKHPILQIGSESVCGPLDSILNFIDTKFGSLPLLTKSQLAGFDETTPLVVIALALQHRCIANQLQSIIATAETMISCGGNFSVSRSTGTPKMQVNKLCKSYSNLLEVMLEHAQMEERVVFPVLQNADRGMCKAANEDHARDLPLMNGIKEDFKSIGVLDIASPDFQNTLQSVYVRLKELQENYEHHFAEEEQELLQLEAIGLTSSQQMGLLRQGIELMEATHSHLLKFFTEGLTTFEEIQYLILMIKCKEHSLS